VKKCSKCAEVFGEEFFHKKTAAKDGLYPYCIRCTKQKNAKYYSENKAFFAESSLAWKRANRGKIAASARSYDRKIQARRNKIEAARRAAKIQSLPAWANEFFIAEAYDLAATRSKVLGFKWHVDHIVPLKSPIVCGLHTEQNLRVIPARENISKGNRVWPDMP
jgi:hypothetical protein